MIFACGVRFIRLRSISVRGCASGSVRAARSTASALIDRGGLSVLPEVVVLLTLRYPTGRNDTNALIAFCVGHKQQDRAFRHADDDKTFLTIVFTIIEPLYGKRGFEHRPRQLEAHAVGL